MSVPIVTGNVSDMSVFRMNCLRRLAVKFLMRSLT